MINARIKELVTETFFRLTGRNRSPWRAQEKLDLLYVLGSGSTHDDLELRYSLRSIEKYCKNYGRIIVVGRKPEWLTNVEFIPCDDNMGSAHKNMMKKILWAVHHQSCHISDWFVVQADDHFYTRPYDFRKISNYYKDELPRTLEECDFDDQYKISMVDTYHYLKKKGYPTKNGSMHCGFLFNRSLMLQLESELFAPGFYKQFGIESFTVMASALNKHLHIPYRYRKDCKVRSFLGEKGLVEKIDGNFCFSIYDRAFQHALLPILQRWYPEPSKYEKF